jgi:hypothetical protein
MKKLLLYLLLFSSFNVTAQTNNYSLQFDGVDDYIGVNPLVRNANADLTINYWAKGQGAGTCAKTPQYESYFSYTNDVNGSWIAYHLGILQTNSGYNWDVTAYGDLSTDYHFYSITVDDLGNGSTIAEVFLDGASLGQHTYPYSIPSYSEMEIGRNIVEQNGLYDGNISHIHMWDGLLTLSEIQQYMNCPPTGNEAGLVGYWNFEEGSGTIANDLSTNSNNGTLINSPSWSTDVPPYNCCTPNPITSQPTDQSVTTGNDAVFSFTDTLTGATYQWQIDAGTGFSNLSNAGQYSGTDAQTLTVAAVTMGNNNSLFRCLVTESSSCMDTTDTATLTVIDNTSIDELNNSLVQLFPNPSNGIITLTLAQHSNGQIILTDILGKEVLSKRFTTNEVQVNLKRLAAKGTYFAKIIDLDGNVIAIKKLIYQ